MIAGRAWVLARHDDSTPRARPGLRPSDPRRRGAGPEAAGARRGARRRPGSRPQRELIRGSRAHERRRPPSRGAECAVDPMRQVSRINRTPGSCGREGGGFPAPGAGNPPSSHGTAAVSREAAVSSSPPYPRSQPDGRSPSGPSGQRQPPGCGGLDRLDHRAASVVEQRAPASVRRDPVRREAATPGARRPRMSVGGHGRGRVRGLDKLDHRGQVGHRRPGAQRWSTTQSMQCVSASTSAGSTAGYMAIRSWLRPSLR